MHAGSQLSGNGTGEHAGKRHHHQACSSSRGKPSFAEVADEHPDQKERQRGTEQNQPDEAGA